MLKELRTCLTLFLLLMLLTGFAYPMTVLAIGRSYMPTQANGSLLRADGQFIGSEVVGQAFTGDIYFHSRPSSAGNGYDASNSSGSNVSSTNADYIKNITDQVGQFRQSGSVLPVPIDLITASGSGLDPDISPAAASFQIARIAEIREANPYVLDELVEKYTTKRQLGFLGEPRVNVLQLNLALDHMFPVIDIAVP